jgi:exopolyphosphatase/guanosine-5'-triphosphate,3'-diphosphate pyrophosphatase
MDPLLAAGRDLAGAFGRDLAMPAALEHWTAGLFGSAPGAPERLRRVACWMSDIGSHDHPDYRAEQAFLRVLRQPGVALDHPARAFLALTLAIRYEAEPEAAFLNQARALLNPATGQKTQAQAEALGLALRLAYTLSAGTPALLSGTRLTREGGRLVLHLDQTRGVSGGDGVVRRLDRLAQALGCEGVVRGG